MKAAANSRLLLIAVAVLVGLIVSASEIQALTVTETEATSASLAEYLPFIEGAPSPLAVIALGCLVIGVTFARRLRKRSAQA